jgi:hypothetical protein
MAGQFLVDDKSQVLSPMRSSTTALEPHGCIVGYSAYWKKKQNFLERFLKIGMPLPPSHNPLTLDEVIFATR